MVGINPELSFGSLPETGTMFHEQSFASRISHVPIDYKRFFVFEHTAFWVDDLVQTGH